LVRENCELRQCNVIAVDVLPDDMG
jgi:hypothetical protein